ncbi:hypothetical protein PHMEG_00022895 [Phytophthora megakarya]|uniref:Reverse transcriptase n=1 Tax=Phytophthora megakarya TaxID=4795 RepID=A0A225VIB6_9STRA|nr:hypothetical protein PHMEG_00022895 [Phytophthora megakarya]
MKLAEEAAKRRRLPDDDSDFALTTTRTKFDAGRQASLKLDPVLRMVNDRYAEFPAFQRRSFVDSVCFGGTTFDECLDSLDKLLAWLGECMISSKVDVLSHEVSPEGIRTDPKMMTTAITKLPFPKSKKGMQQFLGSLNYYSRFI